MCCRMPQNITTVKVYCFEDAKKHIALTCVRPQMDVECWKRCVGKGYSITIGFNMFPTAGGGRFGDAAKPPFIAPTPGPQDFTESARCVLAVE